jgi:hypothetical protein
MTRKTTKAGTKLTRAAQKRLADEAERGYDLDQAIVERVGPGRPSLGKGESPRITYRVRLSTLEAAERRAKSEGRTVSAIARDALERYLRS